MRDAADYIGETSREIQARYPENERAEGFSPDVNFIFGGKIGDASARPVSHLSAGQLRITDRGWRRSCRSVSRNTANRYSIASFEFDTALETVALCGLVSMDSTMRSNASVGPPIELMMYHAGAPGPHTHVVYEEDNPYLRQIREAWAENLKPRVRSPACDQLAAEGSPRRPLKRRNRSGARIRSSRQSPTL